GPRRESLGPRNRNIEREPLDYCALQHAGSRADPLLSQRSAEGIAQMAKHLTRRHTAPQRLAVLPDSRHPIDDRPPHGRIGQGQHGREFHRTMRGIMVWMRIFIFSMLLIGGALSAQVPAPKPKTPLPVKPPAAASSTPSAQPFDKVVLTVGDEKMTVGDFEKFVDTLPEQYRAQARGPGKRQIVDQLVSLKALAQEARKRKLDQDPAFKAQLAFQAENLLAGTLFRDLSANLKVEDADVRKYYDDHKNEYERVKARHILVRFKGSAAPAGKKELTEEEA